MASPIKTFVAKQAELSVFTVISEGQTIVGGTGVDKETTIIFDRIIPQELVFVTKNSPAVFTVIEGVVAPVFQDPAVFPERITLLLSQKVVGPFAEIRKSTGSGSMLMMIWFDSTFPQALEFVTK